MMGTRTLPDDVALLSWLSEQTGVSESTLYRLAPLGKLADFGVFRIGGQYRCSKVKALRKIHGEAQDSES